MSDALRAEAENIVANAIVVDPASARGRYLIDTLIAFAKLERLRGRLEQVAVDALYVRTFTHLISASEVRYREYCNVLADAMAFAHSKSLRAELEALEREEPGNGA